MSTHHTPPPAAPPELCGGPGCSNIPPNGGDGLPKTYCCEGCRSRARRARQAHREQHQNDTDRPRPPVSSWAPPATGALAPALHDVRAPAAFTVVFQPPSNYEDSRISGWTSA